VVFNRSPTQILTDFFFVAGKSLVTPQGTIYDDSEDFCNVASASDSLNVDASRRGYFALS
jgi:hypothetical protein